MLTNVSDGQNEPFSADGRLGLIGWGLAFALAAIAVYSPVVLIGLLGFMHDPQCGVQWWKHVLVLPGLGAWCVLVFAQDLQIAGIKLRRLQPPWIGMFWAQFSTSLQTAPQWVHWCMAAGLTLVFISTLAALFRLFPRRSRGREAIFIGGLICSSGCAALAYAMFRA